MTHWLSRRGRDDPEYRRRVPSGPISMRTAATQWALTRYPGFLTGYSVLTSLSIRNLQDIEGDGKQEDPARWHRRRWSPRYPETTARNRSGRGFVICEALVN